jgi:formate-dependent nitrite reductase cytochrome c552 subunit
LALATAALALVLPRNHDHPSPLTPLDQPAPTKPFPVQIHQPDGPPTVLTGETDLRGQPILAACSTCHTTRTPNPSLTRGDQLTEFHQGLTTAHGNVACLACHDSSDYDSLHLANGDRVPFPSVMNLCGQCHGPQLRDYQHGAHGGMTGHWDLTQGPQQRNNCIDCHDPHAPAYPAVTPAFPPRDRFSNPSSHANSAPTTEKGTDHE